MIDVHSHIIPGIDDGARTMEMALDMARQTVDSGVTHLVCTPHMHWGTFDNTKAIIREGYAALLESINAAGIPLTLSWAGEIRINEMVPVWFKDDKLPFLGQINNQQVLLLEMPHSNMPAGLDQLFRWFRNAGVQPLIPHPERNRDIWKQPEKIQWLRNQGCMLQVTAGAFTGRFGDHVQKIAEEMLIKNQIDVVASDTHDTLRRPNEMGAAFERVSVLHSAQRAKQLFVQTPAEIVAANSVAT
ncbi:tyrosine-protein phosphatase [Salinimonas chungwhensis]|uniref:tyrosine-protein phosphatase n=1 Tax=Salinimonas chungwhensis TaxID=265425 RepID=UPI0003676FCB|nr:CpsB/CapC family capsule biosynthesis tyrosine phosphatase [Salinimonas chungwhensis]